MLLSITVNQHIKVNQSYAIQCVALVFYNSQKVIVRMKKKLTIKQKKYTGESSVVSLRMPNQLIKRIDETAEISGRTRNDIIMKCIDFALDNLEIESNSVDDETDTDE